MKKALTPRQSPHYIRGTDPDVLTELKELAIRNQGVLKPEAVVEAARSEDSPLHDKFEWDDSEAAEKYRLIQARLMISVSVEYFKTSSGKAAPTKVFVHLSTDRADGGGYRQLVDVLSDSDMKNQLLQDSLQQLTHFQEKYKTLQELKDVFVAIDKTKKRLK